MSEPKLHHYVPEFYLKRFAGPDGQIWAWDRTTDTVKPSGPNRFAAEKYFYWVQDLADRGHDPLTMEKQFSQLEGEVAAITEEWLDSLRKVEPGEDIDIPEMNREIVSLHLALQHLRTADQRDLLSRFAESEIYKRPLTRSEKAQLHTDLLWKEDMFRPLQVHIHACTWIFARNVSDTPLITSDNPVAFKTGDNRMWVKTGVTADEVYLVYPMAPDIALFCHPRQGRMARAAKFDGHLSPVVLTQDMVEVENHGQVFNASRFVFANREYLDGARELYRHVSENSF